MLHTDSIIDIEIECRRIFQEIAPNRYNSVSVKYTGGPNSFVYINLSTWDIFINIQKGFIEHVKAYKDKYMVEAPSLAEDLLRAYIIHEYGHFSVCPFSNEYYKLILNSMYKTIEPLVTSQKMCEVYTQVISNLFSDTIVNVLGSVRYPEFKASLQHIYCLDFFISNSKQKGIFKFFKRKKFDEAISVAISAMVNMGPLDTDILNKYYPFSYKRLRYVNRILNVFSLGEYKQIKGMPEFYNIIHKNMGLRGNWDQMAKEYALILYPLMKKDMKSSKSSFDRHSEKQGESSGSSDTKKKEKSNPLKDKKGNKPEIPYPNKEGSKKSTPEPKENESNFSKVFNEIDKENKKRSEYVKDFYSINKKLEDRARDIVFKSDIRSNTPSYGYKYGPEENDLLNISIKNIDWGSTKISRSSSGINVVSLFENKSDLVIDIDSEGPVVSSIPDISFIVDSSGSMGDIYLEVVTVIYSILKYLVKIGKAHLINYCSINFSDETRYSGWVPFNDIDVVKKNIINYQGDNTYLDLEIVKKMHSERKDNFITLIITDGHLSNDLRELLESTYATHQNSVHCLVIGYNKGFIEGLRGTQVSYQSVEDIDTLYNAPLVIAKNVYGEISNA